MNATYSPSANQIGDLMNGFNSHVSGSYDGCSSQLYELQQQLSVMHQQVYSLTVEVNSTEYGIYTYEQSCREKTTEITTIEQTRKTKRTKCTTEKTEVKKTLSVLQVDLVQMRQISTTHIQVLPQPQYGVSTGSTGSSGSGTGNGGYGGGFGLGYGSSYGTGYGTGYGQSTGTGSVTTGYSSSSHSSSLHSSGLSTGYGHGTAGGFSSGSGTVTHSTGSSGYGTGVSGASSGGFGPGYGSMGGYSGSSYNSGGFGGQASYTPHPFSGYGLLETDATEKTNEPSSPSAEADPMQARAERTVGVQNMVQETKDVAQRASECMARSKQSQPQEAEVFLEVGHENNETAQYAPTGSGSYSGPAPSGTSPTYPGPAGHAPPTTLYPECREIIIQLEHTFTTAYVSLTRLIEEYSMEVVSHVCEDTVEEEYTQSITVVETEATQVCRRVQVFIQHLNQYKLQLTQAVETEHHIESKLQVLTQQCGTLTQTSTYLTEVTTTLVALGNCPGLNGTTFSLPTYVGSWVYVNQELGHSDPELDAVMLQACKAAYPNYGYSVRPAEVSEIDQYSVQGMPSTNTARSPLLGACPLCEGAILADAEVSHARVCWDSGSNLDVDSRRGTCRQGERAVLCVYEPEQVAY
jgi:hypothetical protein